MLVVEHVDKRFGGLQVLDKCSLTIEQGTITGLIGPNGAGKTTLFNIISGNLAPSDGTIRFEDHDVTGLAPHQLYRRGLVRTFQIAHEFSRMTVLENLLVAAPEQRGDLLRAVFLQPRRVAEQEHQLREQAMGVLDFLALTDLAHTLAGNLSGGQKKLLELGRAMMTRPKMILLDEIGAGVNRTLLQKIARLIRQLHQDGCTFCIIEHDMDFIAALCDPVIVLAAGQPLATGTIATLRNDPDVLAAYFGTRQRSTRSAAGHDA